MSEKVRWTPAAYDDDPTPWSTDRDKFLALVIASQLLDYSKLTAAINDEAATADVLQLCKILISQELLTEWQCSKLRNGQYMGFFLGEYKILDQPVVGEQRYIAEHCVTHKRVAILARRNPAAPNSMEFTIVD